MRLNEHFSLHIYSHISDNSVSSYGIALAYSFYYCRQLNLNLQHGTSQRKDLDLAVGVVLLKYIISPKGYETESFFIVLNTM